MKIPFPSLPSLEIISEERNEKYGDDHSLFGIFWIQKPFKACLLPVLIS